MPAVNQSKAATQGIMDIIKSFAKGEKVDEAQYNALDAALKGKVEIVRNGEKIILPTGMTPEEAITWLLREKAADEAEVAVNTQINTLPLDGAVAFYRVLQRRFGFVNLVKTPSFFGPKPPVMVTVPVGHRAEDSIQVPWGRMELPGIEGYLQTGASITDGHPVFIIGGQVRRKHESVVHEIATEVRREVEQNSIYRARAIKMEFNMADIEKDNPFDDKFAPKFMDTTQNPTIILNADAEARLQCELYNPVQFSAVCREHGVPLKRGVLLSGPYGTGKTLTAYALARACQENKWTFIYLENAAALEKAMGFARLYQPCVIFAEDIDKVIDEHEDPELTIIRNALDSVESKGAEIMVVLTTNNVDLLHPGFLRCGRIDSIVTVDRPDRTSTVRLARLYGETALTGTDNELADALQPVVGQSAAVIREAVERAKLAAVNTAVPGQPLSISPQALSTTASTLADHIQRLNREDKPAEVHPAIALTQMMTKEIEQAVADRVSDML